jgi:hypothetical protein
MLHVKFNGFATFEHKRTSFRQKYFRFFVNVVFRQTVSKEQDSVLLHVFVFMLALTIESNFKQVTFLIQLQSKLHRKD